MNIVRNYIVEKFKEDSDPIEDLSIGLKHKVKKWVKDALNKKYNVYSTVFQVYDFDRNRCIDTPLDTKSIKINDDLSIDVYGWVDVSGNYGKDLPDYIRFNHIYGDFACSFSTDKYLEQMPKQVDGQIRYYMRPYPENADVVKQKIKNVCKVESIKIKF